MNSILLQPIKDSKSAIAQDLHTSAIPALTTLIAEHWDSIRVGLRDVAFENAFEIGQMAQAAVEKALQIGQQLWRMKSDLKRKES
jgi:glycerol kinase